MKRELWWIPFIFLANKTLNMPFVYRHSRKEIEKNPELRNKDYEATLHACKRFLRSPSTIFSYAEGTRYTEEKYNLQKPIYKNLLNPKLAPASLKPLPTCLIPRFVNLIMGGKAKIIVATTPGTKPTPNNITTGIK